jgi:hypothetical protein
MSDSNEAKIVKGYMTRSRACEIIIKMLKTQAIKDNEELSNALKIAWHALLGPEKAGSLGIAPESPQENSAGVYRGEQKPT